MKPASVAPPAPLPVMAQVYRPRFAPLVFHEKLPALSNVGRIGSARVLPGINGAYVGALILSNVKPVTFAKLTRPETVSFRSSAIRARSPTTGSTGGAP